MKIQDIRIENFKSLAKFEITDAPQVVVLAGPNGSGKSSVLEAISTFKEYNWPYTGRRSENFVRTGATYCEIEIRFNVFPGERDYLKSVAGMPDPPNIIKGIMRFDRSGNVVQQNFDNGLPQLLQVYDRQNYPIVGVFDFIDSYRVFRPSQVTSVSLTTTTDAADRSRRFAPADQKFAYLKEYLAQLKMRDIQKAQKEMQAGKKVSLADVGNSLEPIQRLFNRLLAPKEFVDVDLSVSPARYIVKTESGEVDIDHLSSGEKEILFVFADLLKLGPHNSILLFDEPDLHLHQEVDRRIISELTSIGENNQFWTATHSLGIMDSVGYENLFRLESYKGRNQVQRAFDDQSRLEAFRLVAGDAGIVTLGEKIVFLEGTETSDKAILETLVPESRGKIKFVAGGGVRDVMQLGEKIMDLLQTASKFNYFFAIRDRDFLSDSDLAKLRQKGGGRIFVWSRYHIENFLLDHEIIFRVLKRNYLDSPFADAAELLRALAGVAADLSEIILSKWINFDLIEMTQNYNFSVNPANLENDLIRKAQEVSSRISGSLEEGQVRTLLQEKREVVKRALGTDEWMKVFPGRDILKAFRTKYAKDLPYERFRDQVILEMSEQGLVPAEISETLDKIRKTESGG